MSPKTLCLSVPTYIYIYISNDIVSRMKNIGIVCSKSVTVQNTTVTYFPALLSRIPDLIGFSTFVGLIDRRIKEK